MDYKLIDKVIKQLIKKEKQITRKEKVLILFDGARLNEKKCDGLTRAQRKAKTDQLGSWMKHVVTARLDAMQTEDKCSHITSQQFLDAATRGEASDQVIPYCLSNTDQISGMTFATSSRQATDLIFDNDSAEFDGALKRATDHYIVYVKWPKENPEQLVSTGYNVYDFIHESLAGTSE